MTGRKLALWLLYGICAALFGLVGALALGWWGAPLGFFGFLFVLKLPYYNDRS